MLDEAAARRFADYPQLTGRPSIAALERSRNLTINMAIVHQARVNVRLHMLFWHLADRWGRVRSEGVWLPLTTHPLSPPGRRGGHRDDGADRLARQGLIGPVDGGWLLSGEPPGELLELKEIRGPGPAPAVAATTA